MFSHFSGEVHFLQLMWSDRDPNSFSFCRLHYTQTASPPKPTGNHLNTNNTKSNKGTGLSCHIQRFVLAQLPQQHCFFFFFFFFWWCRYWHTVCGHSRDHLPGREGVCATIQPGRQADREEGPKESEEDRDRQKEGLIQQKTIEAC